MPRVILIVMDSVGIGSAADADQFGGEGYNELTFEDAAGELDTDRSDRPGVHPDVAQQVIQIGEYGGLAVGSRYADHLLPQGRLSVDQGGGSAND